MKEQEFEVVLVDEFFVVLARYARTFSLQEETQGLVGTLNMDLGEWAIVRWIARPNAKWLELYHE